MKMCSYPELYDTLMHIEKSGEDTVLIKSFYSFSRLTIHTYTTVGLEKMGYIISF